MTYLDDALALTFGTAFEDLSREHQRLVAEDLQLISTMEERSSFEAAEALRDRIGGLGNLRPYAEALAAGQRPSLTRLQRTLDRVLDPEA